MRWFKCPFHRNRYLTVTSFIFLFCKECDLWLHCRSECNCGRKWSCFFFMAKQKNHHLADIIRKCKQTNFMSFVKVYLRCETRLGDLVLFGCDVWRLFLVSEWLGWMRGKRVESRRLFGRDCLNKRFTLIESYLRAKKVPSYFFP